MAKAIVIALRRRWPAAIAGLTVVLATAAMVREALRLCEGRFVYALDDPYIHMAMARNVALHGSWGITPDRFEPASSSPLWTLLLAALYRLFGVSDLAPLILDLGLAVGVIVVLDRMLRPFIGRDPARALALIGLGLAIALPALVLIGMEPLLHVLLVLMLVWTVARRLTDAEPTLVRGLIVIGLLAALSTLARFESVFLIAILGIAALLRRRPAPAVAMAAGAVAALGGYLAFTLPQGGLLFPNSVVVNAQAIPLLSPDGWLALLRRIPEQILLRRNQHMAVLLTAAGALLVPRREGAHASAALPRLMLAVLIPALLLHVQFAELGFLFRRYEAYLVALGLVAVTIGLAAGLGLAPNARGMSAPVRIVATLAWLALAAPFVMRGVHLLQWTPLAMRNIYEQQYQMGRLVHERFRDRVVAINDLGAVGYYGGARVVDLWGLATTDVARARLERRYDSAFIERLCADRGAVLAMNYESWFPGDRSLPASWRPVARWTIHDNLIAGDSTVTLFATDSATTGDVRDAVHGFSRTLPRRVTVEALE